MKSSLTTPIYIYIYIYIYPFNAITVDNNICRSPHLIPDFCYHWYGDRFRRVGNSCFGWFRFLLHQVP